MLDNSSPSEDQGKLPEQTGPSEVALDFSAFIEASPLLTPGLADMIQTERSHQIKRFGLPADAKTEEIAVACDREFLAQWKAKTRPSAHEALAKYGESSVDKPLDFEDRQAVVNIMVNPTYRLYKNAEGQDVNLTEYLQAYYAPLGIDIKISFQAPTPVQAAAIDEFFVFGLKKYYAAGHLKEDRIALPIIEIKKGERVISVPIVGSDRDIHMPMHDPQTDEEFGSFVSLKIVHEPQLSSGLTTNIGFMVHELDHAIRLALDSDWKAFKAEDRIITEGTAELARHRFSAVQSQHNPDAGYGLSNVLLFAGSIDAEGSAVPGSSNGLKRTYASGLVLTERMEQALGREKFFETCYDAEHAPDNDFLARLRQQIVTKLETMKGAAHDFMVNF